MDTQTPNRSLIGALKQMIKTDAALQRRLKLARRTVREAEAAEAIRKELGIESAHHAVYRVQEGSVRLTAMLNLYHELRGSCHRHNVDGSWTWVYDRERAAIQKQLNTLK